MAKNISRKEFLKATAMSAAGIGLLGAGVLNAKAEEEKPVHKNSSKWVLDSQNVKWDEEHDIVICGYGMAGTAAYIEAYEIDHNVDAVIYDKSDEANAGGQAIASGQCVIFVDPNDLETWRTYMRAMNEPHVIPEEDFNWLTNEFATDLPWIQAVLEPVDYEVGYSGGGALRWGTLLVEFPDLPGANFVGATGHFRDKNGGLSFENGGCWNGFDKAARYRGAKPLYEHQVICLVQDAITKKVEGVGVKKPDGSVIYTKARKGVLLATGGYEFNQQMLKERCRPRGVPGRWLTGAFGNTGDGLQMGVAVGAAEDEFPQSIMLDPEQLMPFVRVNKLGKRFTPEYDPYGQLAMAIQYQPGTYDFYIVDSALDTKIDKIWTPSSSCYGPKENWIAAAQSENAFKADTLEELAELMEVPVDAFVETINHWNEMCAAGADTDFDMPGTMMMTIDQPPFYATKEYADGLCTTGGLIVDTECRVLTKDRQPIPGLFAAGITSGGMFYNTYPHNLNCLSHTRNCLMGYTIGQVLGGKQ